MVRIIIISILILSLLQTSVFAAKWEGAVVGGGLGFAGGMMLGIIFGAWAGAEQRGVYGMIGDSANAGLTAGAVCGVIGIVVGYMIWPDEED